MTDLRDIRRRDAACGDDLAVMALAARERRVLLAEVDRLRAGITRHRTRWPLDHGCSCPMTGDPPSWHYDDCAAHRKPTHADRELWALIGDNSA